MLPCQDTVMVIDRDESVRALASCSLPRELFGDRARGSSQFRGAALVLRHANSGSCFKSGDRAEGSGTSIKPHPLEASCLSPGRACQFPGLCRMGRSQISAVHSDARKGEGTPADLRNCENRRGGL